MSSLNEFYGFEEIVPSKVCLVCGILKPATDFPRNPHHKDGLDGRCRDCIRKRASIVKRIRNDPSTPPKSETCDCCGVVPTKDNPLHLDHDHQTGKFRGWLCGRCNRSIGQLGDSVEGLMRAIHYLQRACNG